MKSYDASNNENCNLGTRGTISCTLEIEVGIKSINGTLETFATHSIIMQSECMQIKTDYDARTSKVPFWSWDPANKAIFDQGYELRTPSVKFELPMLKVDLRSGLSVYS